MEKFDFMNMLYYCLFAAFVYYQQLHLKEYRGASKIFGFVLAIFGFLGMIVGFGYLIYYGYKVAWWTPFVVFFAGLIFMLFATLLEKLLGKFTLSLLGFVVWPICAYLMFKTIPV